MVALMTTRPLVACASHEQPPGSVQIARTKLPNILSNKVQVRLRIPIDISSRSIPCPFGRDPQERQPLNDSPTEQMLFNNLRHV